MDHDPNQPQSSSSGQQPPPLDQRPPSQSELPQQPPLYESPPHWGQQPLPQDRQPPYGQPQYGGSPIPTFWPPQPPKKRSSRWPRIILALLAGLIALSCIGSAIFVALRISSPARLPRSVTSPPGNARLAGPVTNLNDNGPGSLRYAVDVTPAGGTITFDKSLRGTIPGGLNIVNVKDLIIRGPGAGILSISGGVIVQAASVTLSGLTFENGEIVNQGTLTLTNSTVSGNSGVGIVNQGTLTLTNSTVSGNRGGGISSQGTLTLTNSTVSGNTSSGLAGGIFSQGTLTLTNSTVSGNTSSGLGGGIFSQSTLTLSYSTIWGNTATGPDGDGGGIVSQGQMTMGASIVAGNKAHTDPDISGSLTTLGYNVVGDRSGATFLGSPKQQSTDVLGVPSTALRIDPILRDNGGSAQPHTWTHALLSGSPAIDLIPPEACRMFKVFNDQRGVKRPQGKGCDSGAYEYSQ